MFQQNGHDKFKANLLDDENAVYGDVMCSLENIPDSIMISGIQYILRGVAVFIGKRMAARTSMGHYIALTKRIDGNWEKYDDFQKKVNVVSKHMKCRIQMILYTKK